MIGATALVAESRYFDILIYGGIAAVALGTLGLVGLFVTAHKPKPGLNPASDQSVTSHNQSGGVTARNAGLAENE